MKLSIRRSVQFAWPAATTLLAWLLPVFAWAPLAYPGYFEFHSGSLPIFNLTDLMQRLTDLGWAPTVGQPYDLLRGERVLPYLLAAALRLLGASSVAAVKLVFGLSLLAGALGMVGWARRRLGSWPALVAAAVYVYWPMGLATVYVRGAFAEAALLGLLPFVLWAADAAADGSRRGAVGLALGVAAALWTQMGLALWLAVIVLGYALARRTGDSAALRGQPIRHAARVKSSPLDSAHRQRSISLTGRLGPLAGWAGGLALGTLGLLPVILRHGWGGSTYVNFTDHFVYLNQLLWAGGGNGVSVAGPDDALTFSVGIMVFVLAVVSCFSLGSPADALRAEGRALRLSQRRAGGIALALMALSTVLAAPLWRLLPFLGRTLTYPWQLLLLAGPWLAWLGGAGSRVVLDLWPAEQRERSAAVLCAALIALVVLGVHGAPAPLGPALSPDAEAARAAAADAGQPLNPVTADAPPDAPLAIFGRDEIALVSATPEGAPGPGGRVTLRVRWEALRPLTQDYTVFVHAIGPDGVRYGQLDTMPQGNSSPTSGWRPGQVVGDVYDLVLASDAPIGGDYRYLLGFYLLQTGERLTAGADDKVTLTP